MYAPIASSNHMQQGTSCTSKGRAEVAVARPCALRQRLGSKVLSRPPGVPERTWRTLGGSGGSYLRSRVTIARAQGISDADLENLRSENARLKAFLSKNMEKLRPEVRSQLEAQYAKIKALGEKIGVDLEPWGSKEGKENGTGNKAVASSPSPTPPPPSPPPPSFPPPRPSRPSSVTPPPAAATSSPPTSKASPIKAPSHTEKDPAKAVQVDIVNLRDGVLFSFDHDPASAQATTSKTAPKKDAPAPPSATASTAPKASPSSQATASKPATASPAKESSKTSPPTTSAPAPISNGKVVTASAASIREPPPPSSPKTPGTHPPTTAKGVSSPASSTKTSGGGEKTASKAPVPPTREFDIELAHEEVSAEELARLQQELAKVQEAVKDIRQSEAMRKEEMRANQVEVPPIRVAQLRAMARDQLRSLNWATVADNRHDWLYFTVPEKPVAGEDVILFYNRLRSDALRVRPRILAQIGYNHWELEAEAPRLELKPSSVPRDQGSDFWTVQWKVPEDAFEVNVVFTDGENLFDNNYGVDYLLPCEGGPSLDQWLDKAAERAARLEEERREAERLAAIEEEKKRQAALIQQDKNKALARAQDLQNQYNNLQQGFVANTDIFMSQPAKLMPGQKGKLYYNRQATCLNWLTIPDGQAIELKYGCNGWKRPRETPFRRVAKSDLSKAMASVKDADWWVADIEVPFDAAVINWVVHYYEHYDNNGSKDYSLSVSLPGGVELEDWVESLKVRYEEEERQIRFQIEEEERKKAEKRRIKREQAQDQVKAVQRRQIRHVLYTEPAVINAGETISLFYSPQDTCLNGHERIFVQGGWNRWAHKKTFGPIEMKPPAPGSSHYQADIQVPKDAFKMDMVFADVASGEGTYDNRMGLDYHLPVEGSLAKEPTLHVVHIAVEMAPIAKVGGLGDVVIALGRAVKEQGHLVEVILPKYRFFNNSPVLGGMKFETEFDWGGTRIYVTSCIVEGLRVFFIEPKNNFFETESVYGRYDDEVRFDFFCKAALEFLLQTQRQPDILHCHDWSTATVARSYWQDYHLYGLWKPKVIFTIHNLNYGQKKIGEAAYFSQKFTTVSPTYAFETGGHPAISAHMHKFMGIRNGIDMDLWDPENNLWLPVPYNSENMVEGKKAAREKLRQRLNLTSWNDKFIVAVISRLTTQKGVHLIKHAAWRASERGGQFVLLGSAPDPKVQAEFNSLAQSMGGQDAAFCFTYDEPLSHLIYAAADMMVVPSMFEPCGLTQMIAMRYGTVPVVRHTGGLKDTVFDVDFDKARAAWDVYGSSDWQRDGLDATNGFAFEGTDPGALDYAMNRSIDAWYNDRNWFHSLQKRCMEQDWSWSRPALDYIELYFSALKS